MSQMLNGRDEVKALPLQTIFEDATHGEDTVFVHSDEATFTFAKQRARTATQRMGFTGRVSVLTDKAALTITYAKSGSWAAQSPLAVRAATKRAEKRAAALTGVVIETRVLGGNSKPLPHGEYDLDDPTLVDGEIVYGCLPHPPGSLSVGPVAAKEDDIRCAHCGRTNASALVEFGGITYEEGQEVMPAPTIQALYRIEGGRTVRIVRGTGRKTRKEVREGPLGEAIQDAAVKARRIRKKKERESLARRRGR